MNVLLHRIFSSVKWAMVRFGNFLIPNKRPMDDMEAGWKLPQEDEFARDEPRRAIALPADRLPQEPPPHMDFLDMQISDSNALRLWQESFSGSCEP